MGNHLYDWIEKFYMQEGSHANCTIQIRFVHCTSKHWNDYKQALQNVKGTKNGGMNGPEERDE